MNSYSERDATAADKGSKLVTNQRSTLHVVIANMPFNVLTPTLPALSPTLILWGLFGLILVVFAIVSVVLLYHWQRYRVTSAVPRAIVAAYFVVAAVPIAVMLLSLVAYSLP